MNLYRSQPVSRGFALIVVSGIMLAGCEPAVHQAASPASRYDVAKAAFKNGDMDKALEFTEGLANASPPAETTEQARVLRTVIFAGELKGYMELADAYSKGANKAKSTRFQSEYRRLDNDMLSSAGKTALYLAEIAHQLAPEGVISKQCVLDTNYPVTEGPVEVKDLARVEAGGWIEPDQRAAVTADALHKGIDDALAEFVSGDRAKARQALASGSTQLDGSAYAIFLATQLVQGAEAFDRHHGRDPQKLLTLCDEGEECLKAARALLKDTPNASQDKEVKKLSEKFKTLRQDR